MSRCVPNRPKIKLIPGLLPLLPTATPVVFWRPLFHYLDFLARRLPSRPYSGFMTYLVMRVQLVFFRDLSNPLQAPEPILPCFADVYLDELPFPDSLLFRHLLRNTYDD